MNLKFRAINRAIKKELKRYKKEKKRCQKTYVDWSDDPYNCLDLKFLWAIDYKNNTRDTDFNTLNQAILYYNRQTEKYEMGIDISELTMSDFPTYLWNIYEHIWSDPRFLFTSGPEEQIPQHCSIEFTQYELYLAANDLKTLVKNLYMLVCYYDVLIKKEN